MTQIDEKIYHIHGLELILLKWPYYPRQSTDSVQSLLKYQGPFSWNYRKIILKLVWKYKIPPIAKIILRKRTKLKE